VEEASAARDTKEERERERYSKARTRTAAGKRSSARRGGTRGGQDGRSWFVCRRLGEHQEDGIGGMITFVSYLTLERAG